MPDIPEESFASTATSVNPFAPSGSGNGMPNAGSPSLSLPATPPPSLGTGGHRLWIVTADDEKRFGPADKNTLLRWWEEGRIHFDSVLHDAETTEETTIGEALRLPLILEDRQVHTYIHPHEAELGFLRTVRLDPHREPEVIKVPGGLFPPGQTRIKYRVNAGLRSADGKRRGNLVLFISVHPPGKGPVSQPSDVLLAQKLQPKPNEPTPEDLPPVRLNLGGTPPVPNSEPNIAPKSENSVKENPAMGSVPNTAPPPPALAATDIKYIRLAPVQAVQGGDFAMTLTDGRTMTFRIPPGTVNGQQLLYPQSGARTPEGQPTDLLIVIEVA